MKILQINSVCGSGSTGRIAVDLSDMLTEKGHDCMIVYGRGSAPEKVKSVKVSANLDNYLHALLTRITDRHGFGSVKATMGLIKEIENYDPDLIHLHNIHGYYVNIELLFNYLKKAGKPVVWTLHDCWSFTGHCAYFDYAGCERWKNSCFRCPQKKTYPSSRLIDNSSLNYRRKKQLFTSVKNMTIVSPSVWLASLAKESFLGKYPVRIINNGIDLNIFCPSVATEKDKADLKERFGCASQFVILGVANIWEERKGMKYLLELADKLNDQFRVMIVGVTEKQKASLPGNVIGITKTDNIHQLAEIYSMVDVFVNPTLEEVLGLTNIEALACGTSVITFETGGSPECIDDTCGIVVKKGDISGLIQAVQKIKENPFSREACISRAHSFNKDDKYVDYMTLYSQMFQ